MRQLTPYSPLLSVIHNQGIAVRWSTGAVLLVKEISLLPGQTHRANWLLWREVHVPPPDDEANAPLGAQLGPCHVAKVFGNATLYLLAFKAADLPASVSYSCLLGKLGV